MPMYMLINDAGVAQSLRDAGFCVILSNHSPDCQYLVIDSVGVREYLLANFAEHTFIKTDVVCF